MWDRDFPEFCENADPIECRERLEVVLAESDPEIARIRRAARDVARYAKLDRQISGPLRNAIGELLKALDDAGLVGEED